MGGMLSSMRSGLTDMGRHIISGFSKLTGMEMPEGSDDGYYYVGEGEHLHGVGHHSQVDVYADGPEGNYLTEEEPSVSRPEQHRRVKTVFLS